MNLLPVEKYYIKSSTTVMQVAFPWHEAHAESWIADIKNRGDSMGRRTNLKTKVMTKFDDLLRDEKYDPFKEFIINISTFMPESNDTQLLTLVDMWGAIYGKGDWADAHSHQPSQISFCYYLKTSNNSSPLVFPTCDFRIGAEAGYVLIFPSWLQHSVPPQQIDEERIVISGNINMVNKKGTFDDTE